MGYFDYRERFPFERFSQLSKDEIIHMYMFLQGHFAERLSADNEHGHISVSYDDFRAVYSTIDEFSSQHDPDVKIREISFFYGTPYNSIGIIHDTYLNYVLVHVILENSTKVIAKDYARSVIKELEKLRPITIASEPSLKNDSIQENRNPNANAKGVKAKVQKSLSNQQWTGIGAIVAIIALMVTIFFSCR
ncbi:hypothetical protein LJC07_03950 [Christensenellaceae bacterium OttesenSCG-928-L17]|nr:hypothetical protein [Christensenellaceae bacterium OttesenSCG-928-L17]